MSARLAQLRTHGNLFVPTQYGSVKNYWRGLHKCRDATPNGKASCLRRETRLQHWTHQSPTEGNPPAALAQLSRLYRNYRYVDYLIRTVLGANRLNQAAPAVKST